MIFRNVTFISAIMFCINVNAQQNLNEIVTEKGSISPEVSQGLIDLYSESSYFYEYDFVTDTRLRYYHPLMDLLSMKLLYYVGSNVQYQSSGARAKYYDNTVNPHVGLQLKPVHWLSLQTQVGYRTTVGTDDQPTTTTWDPRMILAAGNFITWPSSQVFTDLYGEASFVPRLSSTPVSIVWGKQGYRWSPQEKMKLDAYAEIYARESRSADLGPTMTEWRLGTRGIWLEPNWSVSVLLFHPVEKETGSGDLEGLLVVGGVF